MDEELWEDPDFSLRVTGRFKAETTPVVTVFSKPRGLPMAIMFSPTASWLESAKLATVKFLGGFLILSTARSVVGSVPTMEAS